MLFFLAAMPTTVGISTFMSRKKFVLSCVEHEKSFITPEPDQYVNDLREQNPVNGFLLLNYIRELH